MSLFVIISVKEAQDILDKKEEACGSRSVEESNTTQSPTPTSPVNIEHRKILTPKGSFFSDISQSLLKTKLFASVLNTGLIPKCENIIWLLSKNCEDAFPPRITGISDFSAHKRTCEG